jgi:hypothetical protein
MQAFRKVDELPLIAHQSTLVKWTTCMYIASIAVLSVSTVYLHFQSTQVVNIVGAKVSILSGQKKTCDLTAHVETGPNREDPRFFCATGQVINCSATLMPSLLFSASTTAWAPSLMFLEMRFTDAFFPSTEACTAWVSDIAEQVVKDAVTPELVVPDSMLISDIDWQNYCISCKDQTSTWKTQILADQLRFPGHLSRS